MRVYVAGKVTGEDSYVVKAKFGHAATLLRKHGHTVFNPMETLSIMTMRGFEYKDVMKMCLQAVSLCDAIYLLNDWVDSAGARMEREFAQAHGKMIFEENKDGVIG